MSKNKPGKALNVLIIDDEPSFVAGLQRDANDPFRIRLDHATNLEDGLLKLQERGEKYFAGVILDVICLKDRKQQIPDPSFISKAIEEFNRLAPSLPKVILTGEPTRAESLKPIFAGNTNVYHKSTEQIEEMLAYLVKQSENMPRIKFAKKYPDVFSIFDDGHLGPNEEQALLECLEKMNSFEPNDIARNLASLRRLHEVMFSVIKNKIDIDSSCSTRDVMRRFSDKKSVDYCTIVASFEWAIYTIASDYGSHAPDPNKPAKYPPTQYTVQALTFAMLDLLLWFKSIVEPH